MMDEGTLEEKKEEEEEEEEEAKFHYAVLAPL